MIKLEHNICFYLALSLTTN